MAISVGAERSLSDYSLAGPKSRQAVESGLADAKWYAPHVRLNNTLYEIASFVVMRESVVWRWSHARHHSDTIIVGRDREIALQRPSSLLKLALKFVNMPTFFLYFQAILRHAFGRVTEEERAFIPESEFGKVFARLTDICTGIWAITSNTTSSRWFRITTCLNCMNWSGTNCHRPATA